jgi:hypothetical protein
MTYPRLRVVCKLLFNTFWVGFGLMMLSWVLYILGKAFWLQFLLSQWHITQVDFIEMMSLTLFGVVKVVLFFGVLVPALAIRWTLHQLDKNGI